MEVVGTGSRINLIFKSFELKVQDVTWQAANHQKNSSSFKSSNGGMPDLNNVLYQTTNIFGNIGADGIFGIKKQVEQVENLVKRY